MSRKLKILNSSESKLKINHSETINKLNISNILYPIYYDISEDYLWTNNSSWQGDYPQKVSIFGDQALINDYGNSGQFVSLDIADGIENWANNLGSSGYEKCIIADASLNYYWGDGYGGGNMGKSNSGLTSQWIRSMTGDIEHIKIDKANSYIYSIEGFGSTSSYPIYKYSVDNVYQWKVAMNYININMEIDLDEDYIIVSSIDQVTRVNSDASIGWQYSYVGHSGSVSMYGPSIDGNNNVYVPFLDNRAEITACYLLKLDESGNEVWVKHLGDFNAGGDYFRVTDSKIASDGNILVLERTGNNPYYTYISKYRASDGLLMIRYLIATTSSGLSVSFSLVDGTNDIIVPISGGYCVKRFTLNN